MLQAITEPTGGPHEDLALDELLFEAVEDERIAESLRLWECHQVTVIMGRFGVVRSEVYEESCLRDHVPLVRRTSGGGSVVVGRGCLNYSLVLSLDRRPELQNVTRSYGIILGRIASALDLPGLEVRGLGDLALNERKVSGSAQRRGRHALLHHGTMLYDFDLRLMECYLKKPARQPVYRRGRAHAEFAANLPLSGETIRARLARAWPLSRTECPP